MFNAELRHLVETLEAAQASGNQNFKTLLNFSLGRAGRKTAMLGLGIESQENLFLLMAQAHPPIPRRPETSTQPSVTSLHKQAR